MADEQTASTELYTVNMAELEDIHEPDNLVAKNDVKVGKIKITVPGSYTRGELLMSAGNNEFVAATKNGLSSAKELCILCESVELDENAFTESAGYFAGTFSGEKIIIPYEDVNSVHSEELEAILPVLRQHNIFID